MTYVVVQKCDGYYKLHNLVGTLSGCEVNPSGIGSVFDCPNNIIVLAHTVQNIKDECGAASAQLEPRDGNNYTSVLTIVPTLEMNGSIIQCAFPSSSDIIGNGTLNVIGKLCIVL